MEGRPMSAPLMTDSKVDAEQLQAFAIYSDSGYLPELGSEVTGEVGVQQHRLCSSCFVH